MNTIKIYKPAIRRLCKLSSANLQYLINVEQNNKKHKHLDTPANSQKDILPAINQSAVISTLRCEIKIIPVLCLYMNNDNMADILNKNNYDGVIPKGWTFSDFTLFHKIADLLFSETYNCNEQLFKDDFNSLDSKNTRDAMQIYLKSAYVMTLVSDYDKTNRIETFYFFINNIYKTIVEYKRDQLNNRYIKVYNIIPYDADKK